MERGFETDALDEAVCIPVMDADLVSDEDDA